MAVDQENVSKVLSVLSHPLRREILLDLSNNGESSFTDLLNLLKVDTGKLSFHFVRFHHLLSRHQAANTNLAGLEKAQFELSMMLRAGRKLPMYKAKQVTYLLLHLKKGLLAFLIDFALIFAITVAITFLPQLLSPNLRL